MSATFNYDLFANYFSRKSVESIESHSVYVGAQEQYDKEEKERQHRQEHGWGAANSEDWTRKTTAAMEDDDDEWVEKKPVEKAPVKKADDPADVVVINARCFKVEELYLDGIIKNIQQEVRRDRIKLSSQDKELLMEAQQTSSNYIKPQVKDCTMRTASIIICDVIERLNTFQDAEAKQSVLVFLPGLAEIFQFIDFIHESYDRLWIQQNLELIPLHSSLNEEEQDRAFKTVQKGSRRKVIVSTNLAESSITIPDVKFVIDFMLTKEVHYDPTSRSESLELTWCSRANAVQRAGRAGRVMNGHAFRLVTQHFFKHSVPEFPVPEMQRCPLEKLILQIKLWDRYEPE
jgi:HrpA-like RNA helicase